MNQMNHFISKLSLQHNNFIYYMELYWSIIFVLLDEMQSGQQAPQRTILVPMGKNGITNGGLWPNKRIPYVISAAYSTTH